jgi:hypothetical protein
LVAVLSIVVPIEPLWAVFSVSFTTITKWAVMARYPGTSTTSIDAREAVKICRRFHEAARASLGL